MNSKYTILVVDDVVENLEIVSKMLQKYGYQVVFAATAEKAIQLAKSKKPDVILMDIMLPDGDGREVTGVLKKDPEFANTPVLFLTALGDTDTIASAFEAGGVDFVSKPIREKELVARVSTHLRIANLEKEKDSQLKTIKSLYHTLQEEIREAEATQKYIIQTDFEESEYYKLDSYYKPYQTVGGDLISTKTNQDESLDIFFGDISGHGISSSMMSGMYVLAFKHVTDSFYSPKANLETIHIAIDSFTHFHYLCCVLARFKPTKKTLEYSIAAHFPPVIVRDRKIIELEGSGLPLNVFKEVKLSNYQVQLESGDQVIFFSDGLVDFWIEDDAEIFGAEKFMKSLRTYLEKNPKLSTLDLLEIVKPFNSLGFRDDVTILVMDIF